MIWLEYNSAGPITTVATEYIEVVQALAYSMLVEALEDDLARGIMDQ